MAKQTFTTGQVLTAAQMTSLQQTAMLGGAASAKVASYVLVAADAGDAITMSNAGATTITVDTGLFATGDIVTIINIGAGTCTITAGTATVTTSGSLVLAQNQGGVLRFTSPSAAIFLQFATPASGDIEGVTATSPLTGGGTSGTVTVGIQDASTSQRGSVQLSDSTSTTSSVLAATPTAVKSAYDLAAAAIPKSTVTTNGDLIYGTGSSAVTRLGIGSSGQVLTVSGGVPAWATASAAGIDWVLVSTTTTNTGNSYTISGLGSYKKLNIFYSGVSNSATNGARLRFRINGDTGSNYNAYVIDFNTSGSATLANEARLSQTSLELAKQGTASAADTLSGYIFMDGCDGTGDKMGIQQGASNQASTQARGIMGGFRYDASAGISNVTFFFDTDNFDAGTITIYGSLN